MSPFDVLRAAQRGLPDTPTHASIVTKTRE
jgi:hypothetical protein